MGKPTTTKSVMVFIIPATRREAAWLIQLG